jgi:hopanoid biosynthesis associated radical SAM protein HpnJ
VKRTLFLNPPSFEGYDGGAGSRYQARREVTSFWYPTWLAQAAALVPNSKLIDAPPHCLSTEEVLSAAQDYDLIVMHTSTPSLSNDIKFAEAIKANNPDTLVGFVGAHVMVLPEQTLSRSPCIDFVCRGEFEYPCLELAQGKAYQDIEGLSYRAYDGTIVRNPERALIQDWDSLPSVLPIYHRDLEIERYFIGYLFHPYVSLYTGRGCAARCTFCLWPQTIGGHTYRGKSPSALIDEIERGAALFPQAREWFLDDDTFTADKARAIEISKGLKRLKITWSCNARANLDYETLKALRANGLRLVVVGFETGNREILKRIKKGVTIERAREFMRHCRGLGIKVHGTFVLGLPVETRDTMEETIRFAQELDPHTIQVSIAAPYPGTELYDDAMRNGWLGSETLVEGSGIQSSPLHYPDLTPDEIEEGVERMYRRFYFRARPIMRMLREMVASKRVFLRRIREGREFLSYLNERKESGRAQGPKEQSRRCARG